MHKKRDDDQFKGATMTFGEHLEELRMAVMKALLWLAIGMAIGLFVGNRAVDVIKFPFLGAFGTVVLRFVIALVVGVVISSPMIAYHIWAFVAAGRRR